MGSFSCINLYRMKIKHYVRSWSEGNYSKCLHTMGILITISDVHVNIISPPGTNVI